MLKITDLHAKINDREILKGLSLDISAGQVHAIMGRNGAGKSTLSNVLMGSQDYALTAGKIEFDGHDITDLPTDKRANLGLFMAFQYPVEIPGLSYNVFLKHALNSKRKSAGLEELSAPDFIRHIVSKSRELGVDDQMLKRALNVGFSGGEKKRFETLQMAVLEPKLCILDELDSGLDIDAMKIVADGVNRLRDGTRAFLVITHYQKLLEYIKPDFVHIINDGKIVKSGTAALAKELEEQGYANI